jgi:hypothetical protein
VGRRERRRALPMRRSSLHAVRASLHPPPAIPGRPSRSWRREAQRRSRRGHRRRSQSCAVSAPGAHMIDEGCGGQVEDVGLPYRMALEKLEMRLFAPLPLGEGLERLDVPADEFAQGNGGVLLSPERDRIFELHLAMPGPGQRGGAMREGLGFPGEDGSATTQPNDRGVADAAVCLATCFDSCDGRCGDKPILSPLCLLRKR